MDSKSMRGAALDYAAHGWPVVPGRLNKDSRLEPIGRARPTTKVSTINRWWQSSNYPILLKVGIFFEAIEVQSAWITKISTLLTRAHESTPILTIEENRSLVFCKSPIEVRSDIQNHSEVVVQPKDSYIMAPPSVVRGIYWAIGPSECDWHLADSYITQLAILSSRPFSHD